jgi:hypothetical protein
MTRVHALVLTIAAATLATGCPMSGGYHSARTLGRGESASGLTFSMTRWSVENDDPATPETETYEFALPNLIPEVTYHIGVTDDVEVGGRVALGSFGMEIDAKWRFFKNDKLHLAVAPAIGYQAFIFLQGGILRLPAIMTYDLNDQFGVNLAAFIGSTHFSEVDEDSFDDQDVLSGDLLQSGVAVSFDVRGETLLFRPGIEFSRYVADFGDGEFEPFNLVNFFVHVAIIGGREKKQLNRMERKLDRVIENQGDPRPPEGDDTDYKGDENIER